MVAAPAVPTLDRAARHLPGPWMWLGTAAALVGASASAVGLLAGNRIYGQETATLADAATAQDAVNLVLVSPLLVATGVAAHRGSVRAYLIWLGCLAFTAYNYAIYAFSIHFGPLFLPWVAVLGLAVYALAGGLAGGDPAEVKAKFGGRSMAVTAWTLIVLAALFMLLWLSEVLPDLLAEAPSRSASDWNVPTNPVHVLDLAIFLPAVLATGVLLLRRHQVGYAAAPAQLVFLALTCVPILFTPAVADLRGHAASWSVVPPMAIVLAVVGAVLSRTLRAMSGYEITNPQRVHRTAVVVSGRSVTIERLQAHDLRPCQDGSGPQVSAQGEDRSQGARAWGEP